MTRDEAKAFIDTIVALRSSATDEQALSAFQIYPAWKEGKTYATGDRVQYSGVLYKVLQDHTSQADWTPTASPSLFSKVLIPDPEVIPEWEQPGSTNPYMTVDKVTHLGKTWVCTMDYNVYEPGIAGWSEVTE